MRKALTAIELGRQIGEGAERIREWQSAGLLATESGDALRPEDLERARLIRLLLRRGVPLAAIVEAQRQEHLLDRHVEIVFQGTSPAMFSPAEAAERLRLDIEVVHRFVEVAGLADQGDLLYDADVRALAGIKRALDAGIPEEAMLQLARVYYDTLGRAAEAESRLFHIYVHDRLKAEGLEQEQIVQVVHESSAAVMPLVEPTILYFHRKAWERAAREDAVLHAREYAVPWEKPDVLGQVQIVVAFVDLAGFTALADVMGDQMAAGVLERFSRLVRDAVGRHEGRVVKQIGDAFMLTFPESRFAVAAAVEIDRVTAEESQFPALRTGIHSGPALYREGDYLGTTLNIAARLAAEADRNQLLVTATVCEEAGGLPGVTFVRLGKRRLRGIAEELELFEIVPNAEAEARLRRLLDPVCGMELAPDDVAVTLRFEGSDRVFCSQQCLQRFAATPELYGSVAHD
jgi:adenylate cyclase